MKRIEGLWLVAIALGGCTGESDSGGDPVVIGGADMGSEADMQIADAAPMPDMAEPDAAPAVECNGGDPDLQPPRLNEHVAVWDPINAQMIVFGGNTAVPENCGFPAYTFQTTTWLYDPAQAEAGCPPWTELEGGPPGRTRHAAAWGDGAMWVFGGRTRAGNSGAYQLYGDLWRFDPADQSWTQVEFAGAERPSARFNTSLIWDSARSRLVLYAGNSNPSGATPTVEADVWTFDPADSTWTRVETGGEVPSRRMWHAALYDEARDRMVVYGGGDETAFFNDAQYFDGVRVLDLETMEWDVLHRGGIGAPAGRFWAGIVHDTVDDTYVMFAGHDDEALGNRNDLWVYDPTNDSWGNPTVGDVWNRPPNGFCDFPADFTVLDPGTPERRNAHSVVWDGTQMVTFGGKTDCGAVNDVWHWDAENGWINPVIATEGEMCIRWRANPDNCANMCF